MFIRYTFLRGLSVQGDDKFLLTYQTRQKRLDQRVFDLTMWETHHKGAIRLPKKPKTSVKVVTVKSFIYDKVENHSRFPINTINENGRRTPTLSAAL